MVSADLASEKLIGTAYAGTVALLIPAFIFTPSPLRVARPADLFLAVGIACTAICIGLAKANGMQFSRLSVSSPAVGKTSTRKTSTK